MKGGMSRADFGKQGKNGRFPSIYYIYNIYAKESCAARVASGGYNGFAAREISGGRSDGMQGICRYEGNGGGGRGKNLGG